MLTFIVDLIYLFMFHQETNGYLISVTKLSNWHAECYYVYLQDPNKDLTNKSLAKMLFLCKDVWD